MKIKIRFDYKKLVVSLLLGGEVFLSGLPGWTVWAAENDTPVFTAMQIELQGAMEKLSGNKIQPPLYYLQYTVTDEHTQTLIVSDGAWFIPQDEHYRFLDVDLRCGNHHLDNTHQLRANNQKVNNYWHRSVLFPLDDNIDAMRAVLWQETEYQFLNAQQRLAQILSERDVKVDEQDPSDDFSPVAVQKYRQESSAMKIDLEPWKIILTQVGQYFSTVQVLTHSQIELMVKDVVIDTHDSEGQKLHYRHPQIYLFLDVAGIAADGMELERNASFFAFEPGHLPAREEVMDAAKRLVNELESLIQAPVVEPYSGPVILSGLATGVFFHEIFGHRIEGHRQKIDFEGQTFTKKINQQIMPEFISIYDDPTMSSFQGVDLSGYYQFDDEGTKAQRVPLVDQGILKNFLMSRSPIKDFQSSNGHGRRERQYRAISRQANLIVESTQTVSDKELRQMLIDECKKRAKPYGLIFDDIVSGFTLTTRANPQAFKVIPRYVRKVYVDGRPDEVVRGVDIVGTPIASLTHIIAAGNQSKVFNGFCGAESGSVPASQVAPSVLISELEVEKSYKGQSKPPLLPAP